LPIFKKKKIARDRKVSLIPAISNDLDIASPGWGPLAAQISCLTGMWLNRTAAILATANHKNFPPPRVARRHCLNL
jgi:hypothetical protein